MKRAPDKSLIFLMLALVGLGTLMIFDASTALAMKKLNGDFMWFARSHLVRVAIGSIGFFAFYIIDYEKLRKYSGLALAVSMVLLAILVAMRIISSGGAGQTIFRKIGALQPSELARLSLIIFLADKLAKARQYADDFMSGFVPLIVVVVAIVIMVALQPNYGMAMTLLSGSLFILFVGKVKLRHLVVLVLIGTLGMFVLITGSKRTEYAMERLKTYWGKGGDTYQVDQSIAAISTGGIFGAGFANSQQKNFLPEAHTDFIFSIIAEEFGLTGSTLILLVFALFLLRGIKIAVRAKDHFGTYLAFGITAFFFVYIAFNIMVATKFMPTTGIPLPFLSFGGNSLIINMSCVGILLNISRKVVKPVNEPLFESKSGFYNFREENGTL